MAEAPAAATPTTWCGGSSVVQADRKPDLLAGRQIDVIYAHASDVADRFATMASPIASDVAAMDAWFRRQDPTRTPRFDLFPFPGCAAGADELDIADVTLPQPASYYRSPDSIFGRLVTDLQGSSYGAINPARKYLVYWDASSSNSGLCGQGSAKTSDYVSGPSWAFVYMGACGVTIGNGDFGAVVAMHELLHTLGAVAPGAPHECPRPNDGHVCDSSTDILYPFLNAGFDTLVLDVNRDDYYGNGGAFDLRNSPWLERLDVPQIPLTVTTGGSGSGHVTSDAGAIDCPGECTSSQEQGMAITLTASAADGSRFTGWSGACQGTDPCSVTLDAAKNVTATFVNGALLALRVSVHGKGRVVSAPTGVSCPGHCSGSFAADSAVTLHAIPAKAYVLSGWSGACHGKGTCKLHLGAASSVRATFVKR